MRKGIGMRVKLRRKCVAIAFKSMLRYWFRAITLGVLPVAEVRDRLEPKLFGAIKPQTHGWMKCQVQETDKPNPSYKRTKSKCLFFPKWHTKIKFFHRNASRKTRCDSAVISKPHLVDVSFGRSWTRSTAAKTFS